MPQIMSKNNLIAILFIIILVLVTIYFVYTSLAISSTTTLPMTTSTTTTTLAPTTTTLPMTTSTTTTTLAPTTTTTLAPTTTTTLAPTTTTTTTTLPMTTPTPTQVDNEQILLAISAANIKGGTEHFSTTSNIVFDTVDKVNKNFVEYFKIFIPSLEIDKVQMLLKENGENDSIQTIINNKNINIIERISEMMTIIAFLTPSLNETNKILTYLFLVNMLSLESRNETNNLYYFNDYNKLKEFYVYYIPNTYTGNKNTITTDITIPELKPLCEMELLPNYGYKISIDKLIKKIIENNIFRNLTQNSCIINENEYNHNKFNNIIEKNINTLYSLLRYSIALLLLQENKKITFTKDTKIINDYADIIIDGFTLELKQYFPVNETDINREGYIFELLRSMNETMNQTMNEPINVSDEVDIF
jgi:hypothetical protein